MLEDILAIGFSEKIEEFPADEYSKHFHLIVYNPDRMYMFHLIHVVCKVYNRAFFMNIEHTAGDFYYRFAMVLRLGQFIEQEH